MHPPSKNCRGLGISKICSKEIGYEPADLTVHPLPPIPKTAESGFIFFMWVFSVCVPIKISSKESLNFSELFRLEDPKMWGFFSIFTQTKF